MASRQYVDDVLKSGRQREYAIADLGTGFSNITENQDALEVVGSTFGEASAMGDMVLECDVAVASNVVTISHPSGEPHMFWFVAPKDYAASDIYMFQNGSNEPVALSVVGPTGETLKSGVWAVGTPVTLTRQGSLAFFGQTVTTAFVKAALLAMWPVGSIYMSFSSANPSTFIGGTWARVAHSRTLISVNESDVDFNVPGKVGGSKTVTLIPANLPPLTVTTQADNGTASNLGIGLDASASPVLVNKALYSGVTVIGSDQSKPISQPFSILPQYMTCYIWERTA